jgi:hypothetical protein
MKESSLYKTLSLDNLQFSKYEINKGLTIVRGGSIGSDPHYQLDMDSNDSDFLLFIL